MSTKARQPKEFGSKIPVYVRDNELWIIHPRSRTDRNIYTSKLNDVFWDIEVIANRGAPEFVLVDDDIRITYEDGDSAVIQYMGDYIVPMDEE